jgi:hypothetical protein
MEDTNPGIEPIETLTVHYLVAPLFVFFAAFIRIEIAVPACALIAFLLYELVRRTAWRGVIKVLSWESAYLLCFATILLSWLYGMGPLPPNADWPKHYAVINFLVQHSWPPEAPMDGLGNVTLRYSIGWYLLPALAVKAIGIPLQHAAMLAWSCLGLFIFLKLLMNIVGKHRAASAAPLAFFLFGGANLIGNAISSGRFGPVNELLQWWAGWIQYSPNLTAISWTPQHALSAWLSVALLVQQRRRALLMPYCALIAAAVALWSIFSAVGLVPFLCALAARHGYRHILLNWRALFSVILLAIPVGVYLTSATGQVPHGFIGSIPCVVSDTLCFTGTRYVLFVLLEIGAPLAILFRRKEDEQGFLAAGAIALCLIPLYRIGEFNDFAMRASGPPIAVLSIFCIKLLITGPKRYSLAVIAILLCALPEVYVELSLPLHRVIPVTPDMTFPQAVEPELLGQYFVSSPRWILRDKPK